MSKLAMDGIPQFSIQAGAQSLKSLVLLETRLQEKQKEICQ